MIGRGFCFWCYFRRDASATLWPSGSLYFLYYILGSDRIREGFLPSLYFKIIFNLLMSFLEWVSSLGEVLMMGMIKKKITCNLYFFIFDAFDFVQKTNNNNSSKKPYSKHSDNKQRWRNESSHTVLFNTDTLHLMEDASLNFFLICNHSIWERVQRIQGKVRTRRR